jgi:hypothetical protein
MKSKNLQITFKTKDKKTHKKKETEEEKPCSIDSADFPCRDPAISSPRSFYGQNICRVGLG